MDSMDVNKAFAAVLVGGIAFVGSSQLAAFLVRPHVIQTPAIKIDLPQKELAGVGPAAVQQEPPIAVLLASADVGRGESGAKSLGCVACHSFNEGGKNGIGPNLYGIMGAKHGHLENFAYSAVLKGKEGPWTYEAMSEWLKKPQTYAPGTKMSYAGIADPARRADVILYLRSLAASPIPLPEAPKTAASPAGGVQQAAASTPAAPPAGGAQQAAASAPAAPPPAAATPAAAGTAALPPAGAVAAAPTPGGGGIIPIAQRLASADAEAGKASTTRLGCVACHSLNEGGRNGVGPNLWGHVGSKIGAHVPTYAYSNALKSKEGNWTYEELDKWLLKPSAYAPGTKMSYAGIADPQVRANVIAFLRTLDSTPEPLPAVSN